MLRAIALILTGVLILVPVSTQTPTWAGSTLDRDLGTSSCVLSLLGVQRRSCHSSRSVDLLER